LATNAEKLRQISDLARKACHASSKRTHHRIAFPDKHHQQYTMTGRGGGGRRVLLPPINFLFRLLQQRTTVQIWLYEQLSIRIVGTIRVSDPAIARIAARRTDVI
jgi:small nuclear ribonucleoprotein E